MLSKLKKYFSLYQEISKKIVGPTKVEKAIIFLCICISIIHVGFLYVESNCFLEILGIGSKIILLLTLAFRIFHNLIDLYSAEPLNIKDKKDFFFVLQMVKYTLMFRLISLIASSLVLLYVVTKWATIELNNRFLTNELLKVTDEISKVTDEISNLTNEISKVTDENLNLTNEISKVTDEISSLTNEISSLTNENLSLKNEISKLINEDSNLKKKE